MKNRTVTWLILFALALILGLLTNGGVPRRGESNAQALADNAADVRRRGLR